MNTQPHVKENNDVVFLGINFGNFFKYCDCIKSRIEKHEDNCSVANSDADDQAQFMNDEKKQKFLEHTTNPTTKDTLEEPPVFNNNSYDNHQNIGNTGFSSTDWVDLDEFTLPADLDFGNLTVEGQMGNEYNPSTEDYFTREPINFDYLKDDKELEKEEKDTDGDGASQSSKLSKNSKKIAKAPIKDEEGNYPKSTFAPRQEKREDHVKGRRKQWQPHEDAKVIELVNKYGQSWAVVASMMGGSRSGKQIRDRYLNKLRPNIKKGDWTGEEDQTLLCMYYQLGHKWSKIATYLPGRTEGQVKNRFYSHIKKRLTGADGAPTPDGQSSDGEQPRREDISMEALLESPDALNNFNKHFTTQLQAPFESMPGKIMTTESPTSNRSITTQQSGGYQNDNDVDQILERVAGLMEKRPAGSPVAAESAMELEKMSLGEKLAAIDKENVNNMNPTDRLEWLEQLQKRRDKLEYLLARTMKDMNVANPPS